jgi:hypothetical protein
VRGLVVADGELGDLVLQVFLGLEAAAPQELAGQSFFRIRWLMTCPVETFIAATYEPAVLPGGQPFGSTVEAYDTAAIVHLTEYAE